MSHLPGCNCHEQLEHERAARRRAEAALKVRDDFLSVAAHELKMPLTSLRGFSEILVAEFDDDSGPPNPERVRRAAKHIREQTGRLSRLLDRLLDISRIGAGRMVLNFEPQDLKVLLQECVRQMRMRDQHRRIVVSMPAERVPATVDPTRIEQVFTNVLDNALKFSTSEVRVSLSANNGLACVKVRDFGPGVDPALRERIFERAFSASPNSESAGLGLGLFISRELITLHGGRIWVDSPEEGRGAVFAIELPRSDGDNGR